MNPSASDRFDLILAGGGLAACLAALRAAAARPDLHVVVAEAQDTLAGDHFWSFHDTDVSPAQLAWLRPLVAHSWDRQRVRFPGRDRTLETGYNSVTSERLAAAVRALPNVEVVTGTPAARVDADGITLADQRRLTGTVLDARGAVPSPHVSVGYQKFLGQWIETDAPHGVTVPTIMDATVPQTDGYRFMYVLPLDARTLHVEDTYYADGDDLPEETLRAAIRDYAAREGWGPFRVTREETGVLPIVLEGDPAAYWAEIVGDGPAPLGMRGLLFNQITGYSLPLAAEAADAVAEEAAAGRLDPASLSRRLCSLSRDVWDRQAFYRALNRMLFRAAAPDQRYVVLRRHYGLSRGLIERFYAGRSTGLDKMRILAGKPPVGIGAALRALPPRKLAGSAPHGG